MPRGFNTAGPYRIAHRILRSRLAAATVLLLLAAWPRLAGLGRFVTWDEPAWIYRTLRFWQAVADGRWEDTLVAAHPGIPTVWLGGLGLALDSAPLAGAWQVVADLEGLGLRLDDDAALKALGPLLAAATWPVALANALLILLCFILADRLVGRWTAFVFAGWLALDPFLVGFARVLHVDALQTGLGAAALLAAAVYARQGGRRYLFVSALTASLAALAKVPGLFVAPWALLLVAARGPRMPRRFADAGLWLLLAATTALLLWPALGADPLGTVEAVRGGGTRYAERAIDTAHFFLGQVVESPGPAFYPVAWLSRAGLWLLLGLLLAPLVWRYGRRAERRVWLAAVALALSYALLLSLSPKKFDRYLLPTWPAWAMAGALGLRALVRWRRWRLPAALGLAALAIALPAMTTARAHPYALAWYAPQAGGLQGALGRLPVGWGEGLDQVARQIEDRARLTATRPVVMTAAMAGLAPLTGSPVLELAPANLPRADLVLRYVSDTQAPVPGWLTETLRAAPLYTATVGGLPYAWLYANPETEQAAEIIRADPAPVLLTPPDLVLRNAPGVDAIPVPPGTVAGDRSGAEWVNAHLSGADWVDALLGEHPEGLWLAVLRDDVPGMEELPPSPDAEALAFRLATRAERGVTRETARLRLTRFRPDPLAEHRYRGEGDWTRSPRARFEGGPELTGSHRRASRLSWSRALGLTLNWAGLDAGAEPLLVSVQLVDQEGRLWGQTDEPLAAPEAGTFASQALTLYAWPGTPPGDYRLLLGVYRASDGQRLTASSDTHPLDDRRVQLGIARVVRAPSQPTLEALAPAIPLASNLGSVRLLGATLPATPRSPGDEAPLTLFWELVDYGGTGERLELLLDTGSVEPSLVLTDTVLPQSEDGRLDPAFLGEPGDRFRSQHRLRVPARAGDGERELWLRLVPQDGQAATPPLRLGGIEVAGRERVFEPPPGIQPDGARFGDLAELVGHSAAWRREGEQAVLALDLVWRALEPTEASYQVFVHLLDAEGKILAQHDGLPQGGATPTAGWLPGEIVVDPVELSLPADRTGALARVVVGLYDRDTGARLPATDGAGRGLGDSVELAVAAATEDPAVP